MSLSVCPVLPLSIISLSLSRWISKRCSVSYRLLRAAIAMGSSVKQPPRPVTRVDKPLDLDLTWLLLQISDELRLQRRRRRSLFVIIGYCRGTQGARC